jgi:hypothetical protein
VENNMAERRWEIRVTGFPTDHSPHEALEDAVDACRKRFGIPAELELCGLVIPWRDGKPIGPAKPLAVELASLAELKRTAETRKDEG